MNIRPWLRRTAAPAAVSLSILASSVAAQVTHDVDIGPGFDFVPRDLTINVGDTVRWTWIDGFHNVESGVGGTADGNFTSGAPTAAPGTQFSVTFDAAFLTANPMPDDLYPYYCIVHEPFGQVGTVTVAHPYGACNSTPGSLFPLAGAPHLGKTLTMGVDDPVGSSAPGAVPFLFVALNPAPGFPCGIPLPGFGMSGPLGDLLVNIVPPDPVAAVNGIVPWTTPGSPVPVDLPVPPTPGFAGLTLHTQAALIGGTSRLTEGSQFNLGVDPH